MKASDLTKQIKVANGRLNGLEDELRAANDKVEQLEAAASKFDEQLDDKDERLATIFEANAEIEAELKEVADDLEAFEWRDLADVYAIALAAARLIRDTERRVRRLYYEIDTSGATDEEASS